MANNVIFVFKAIDQYSKIGRQIADSTRRLNRHMEMAKQTGKRLSAQFKDIGAKVKSAGKNVVAFGRSFSTHISAPLAAFSALSIRAWNTQEKAISKVNAAIRATGGAAGLTFKQIATEASRLQSVTLFGDEEILEKVTAPLLTFKGIQGDNFLETQKQIMNVATLMDGDLRSASIQLGKALNDPIANLGALSRTGIQFTEQQKEVIKMLAQTNNLGRAQEIILKEIESQYGGMAEAAAKAGTGGLKQLLNTVGDISEKIGEEQYKVLRPFINMLRELATRFDNASPAVRKFIAVTALVLTVVGPLIFIFGQLMVGFGMLTMMTGILGTSVFALAAPFLVIIGVIGLVIAAATLLYIRWDDVVSGFKLAISDLPAFFKWVFQQTLSILYSFLSPAIDLFRKFITGGIGMMKTTISSLPDVFRWVFSQLVNLLKSALVRFVQFHVGIGNAIGQLGKDAIDKLKEMVSEALAFFDNFRQKMLEKIQAFRDSIVEFVRGLGDKISGAFSIGGDISTSNSTKTDVNINLAAPRGAVNDIKTRTHGSSRNFNLGVNMEEAL